MLHLLTPSNCICTNKDIQDDVAGMLQSGKPLYIIKDHIDGNKENNYYKNLHWVTKSYNITHMHGMYKDKSRK